MRLGKIIRFIAATSLIFVWSCTSPHHSADLIERAPTVDGLTYRCKDMIAAVNGLRRLGKTEALKALRAHLVTSRGAVNLKEQQEIFLICRLLFVNPNGWERPRLGRPEPGINANAAGQFPLFPLAVSDGVPFLVTTGYTLLGLPEPPDECLKTCEALAIITSDLPSDNYANAARKLIKDEKFKALYPDQGDLETMVELVLVQASKSKTPQ